MGTVTTVISAMIRKEYTGRRNNSLLKCGGRKCVQLAKLPMARRK